MTAWLAKAALLCALPAAAQVCDPRCLCDDEKPRKCFDEDVPYCSSICPRLPHILGCSDWKVRCHRPSPTPKPTPAPGPGPTPWSGMAPDEMYWRDFTSSSDAKNTTPPESSRIHHPDQPGVVSFFRMPKDRLNAASQLNHAGSGVLIMVGVIVVAGAALFCVVVGFSAYQMCQELDAELTDEDGDDLESE
eukprot:TRINITY_DN770_c0_g1_i1.p1 TRINITY_DN770_c0_g1~~TRINITY_DN770_c0_g1_i1.p1  ORF type:complete len:191 (-),score=17.36 TRINITY_DN770_c0_g1_i1:502-1074(-)